MSTPDTAGRGHTSQYSHPQGSQHEETWQIKQQQHMRFGMYSWTGSSSSVPVVCISRRGRIWTRQPLMCLAIVKLSDAQPLLSLMFCAVSHVMLWVSPLMQECGCCRSRLRMWLPVPGFALHCCECAVCLWRAPVGREGGGAANNHHC